MSQENVDLVLGLPYLRADVDIARLVRDDDLWQAGVAATTAMFHDDLECVFSDLIAGGQTYVGEEGMRAAFADWLAPWVSYRNEVEEALDFGDRVVVLYKVFGRLDGSAADIMLQGGDIYTVRDGKISRIAFCTREQALKAVGLKD